MTYKTGKTKTQLRILGKEFVENNRNKGFLIINNKKIPLKEVGDVKKNKILLMINKNIYNKSSMFKDCNLLESFSKISSDEDIENIDKKEIKLDDEFYSQIIEKTIKNNDSFNYWGVSPKVENTSIISEISQRDNKSLNNLEKLNFNKLKNLPNNYSLLKEMFANCESLLSLPDISKMKTNNIIDMSYMFSNCKSLSSLPDISKWNTNNVSSIRYIFRL